jgi:CSLREA domain-containing protein
MFNLVNGPSKIARLFLTTFLAISFTIIFSPEYIGKANSTIVVTTTEDELNNDGDCSLREAITAANTDMNVDNCPAGSSVDTIDLIPNEIFILKSVDNITYGANGLPVVTGEININGNDATIQRDNSANDFRVFFIPDQGSITLNDITIRNGRSSGCLYSPLNCGGGLFIHGGVANIRNVILESNTSTGTNGRGGAIYNVEGNLIIDNSSFQENTAANGGAIENFNGSVKITNSSFINNSASGLGGALDAGDRLSQVDIVETTFNNNSASNGGAIYNGTGSVIIDSSNFYRNNATSAGGGINNDDGDFQIINSLFEDNSAPIGGGIFTDENGSSLVLENSIFRNNAADQGGALNIWESDVTVVDSEFTNNSGTSGGGVYMGYRWGSLQIQNTIFENNSASSIGGGIGNQAPGSIIAIYDSEFTNNSSGRDGGGVYNSYANLTITETTFQNNSSGSGGGLYIGSNVENASISLSTFLENSAHQGGAICNDDDAIVTVSNSYFLGNHASNRGGALLDSFSFVEINNSLFIGNFAGGEGGGAVGSDGGVLRISNSTFSNNIASGDGGGIWPGLETFITNSILWNNEDGSGTIVGGQIGGPAIVKNSLIQDDDPSDLNIPFGGSANGNTDDDPLFIKTPYDGGDGWGDGDDDYGNLSLKFNSPAIDAGDVNFILSDTTDLDKDNDIVEPSPFDLDLTPRISGTSVDMGAYEYHNQPPIADVDGPYLVSIGSSISLDGSGIDPDNDTLTYLWSPDTNLNDPTLEDPIYIGNQAGIETLEFTVTDPSGASDTDTTFVVVYDPDGGFVTGGGWINSPPGACNYDVCNNNTVGKATFGFVSKYKKGADVPTGNTQFHFRAGNLNFHSDSYEWLVVAGPKAQYKGLGTINGVGDFGFMLTAIDEDLTPSTDVDLFRIKIWDKSDNDIVVYDNQVECSEDVIDADPCTQIGGGSIIIHK